MSDLAVSTAEMSNLRRQWLPCSSTTIGCTAIVYPMALYVELFITKLSDFTNRACTEARSVAKRGRDSSTESGPRKAAQDMASSTSADVSVAPRVCRLALFWTGQPRRTNRRQTKLRLGFPLLSTVLHRHLFSSDRRRPTLPV